MATEIVREEYGAASQRGKATELVKDGVTQQPGAMTVRQVIAYLLDFPADLPVRALYDCRCAEGDIVGVEGGADADGNAVVLVVE
jgi:hypothetical protein